MNVLRGISRSNSVITPANLRVFAKVAGGLGVSRVQIPTDLSPVCFSPAGRSGTFENMNSAVINVFDNGCKLEENINR